MSTETNIQKIVLEVFYMHFKNFTTICHDIFYHPQLLKLSAICSMGKCSCQKMCAYERKCYT
uniref:Uncharacterized protein n=1 Tax=Arundo donax TaxID=35708 RepID=A0A0A9E2X2_ARUDO